MRLLVDTHLLLWAVAQSGRLSKEARRLLENPRNDVYYSAASLWEIAIKLGLGRDGFDVDLGELRSALIDMGFIELPVTGVHAERLVALPSIHKDPFDRMLVAQSLSEPLILLTNDDVLKEYGELVHVV
ncbi:MAG TPA: type II toxin-antitoxin system VapC family toxin [Vicinamibacteria bacterium]|nr:type II toxin-antitoxin system VapC family toxin [Vicinamibacteria bacterium]